MLDKFKPWNGITSSPPVKTHLCVCVCVSYLNAPTLLRPDIEPEPERPDMKRLLGRKGNSIPLNHSTHHEKSWTLQFFQQEGTPRKINMEHNHGDLEEHVPF